MYNLKILSICKKIIPDPELNHYYLLCVLIKRTTFISNTSSYMKVGTSITVHTSWTSWTRGIASEGIDTDFLDNKNKL